MDLMFSKFSFLRPVHGRYAISGVILCVNIFRDVPETHTYLTRKVQNHSSDIRGLTETLLQPDGRLRTNYFTIDAPLPSALTRWPDRPQTGPIQRRLLKNFGGISVVFRKPCGFKLIFKSAAKIFHFIIAQAGKLEMGVVNISSRADREETERDIEMGLSSKRSSMAARDFNIFCQVSRRHIWTGNIQRKSDSVIFETFRDGSECRRNKKISVTDWRNEEKKIRISDIYNEKKERIQRANSATTQNSSRSFTDKW